MTKKKNRKQPKKKALSKKPKGTRVTYSDLIMEALAAEAARSIEAVDWATTDSEIRLEAAGKHALAADAAEFATKITSEQLELAIKALETAVKLAYDNSRPRHIAWTCGRALHDIAKIGRQSDAAAVENCSDEMRACHTREFTNAIQDGV